MIFFLFFTVFFLKLWYNIACTEGEVMISKKEMDYSHFILSLLDGVDSSLGSKNPTLDGSSTLLKGVNCFSIYSNDVFSNAFSISENALYQGVFPYPFNFASKIGDYNIFYLPQFFDDSSYAFFHHEIIHSLKDSSFDEKKERYRFGEVIPMFSEMVLSNLEEDLLVQKEILKSRFLLLKMDKKEMMMKRNREGIYYFSNYYYALCLFHEYLKNPSDVLSEVSKVLKQEMTTRNLLSNYELIDSESYPIALQEVQSFFKKM